MPPKRSATKKPKAGPYSVGHVCGNPPTNYVDGPGGRFYCDHGTTDYYARQFADIMNTAYQAGKRSRSKRMVKQCLNR